MRGLDRRLAEAEKPAAGQFYHDSLMSGPEHMSSTNTHGSAQSLHSSHSIPERIPSRVASYTVPVDRVPSYTIPSSDKVRVQDSC